MFDFKFFGFVFDFEFSGFVFNFEFFYLNFEFFGGKKPRIFLFKKQNRIESTVEPIK